MADKSSEMRPGSSLTAAGALRWDGPQYVLDVFQRGVLFLDLLRRRGNDAISMSQNPLATVLRFDHELIMRGQSLPRPINYALLRILPLASVATDPYLRPVVVVDPRAGEGPGIGGFKAHSEIGDALNAGHPVYFIACGADPEPGQTFLDVVEGQVAFIEHVAARHPDVPRPFAIGNCQAGYQTLMGSMLRPELYGPILVAGSPMSFWQGLHGKNPMRYNAGLSGGSWLTALIGDLGHGKFDGAWLILNFDKLGPANWLWGKQYGVFATIDTDGERYLEFEKWWGDFIQLNSAELQYLVDNLFIGDRLARNQLRANDGRIFDFREIASPIIVFTSTGDNISPPQEALGWIPDVYENVEAIREADQTIVYCLTQDIGHLAIFVSSKVGAEQDEAFIQLIDVIDCLPPGLHEMVIGPKPIDMPASSFVTGVWIVRFEARSLDDIRAIGRNTQADDRAFAAVAKLSELNLSLYRTFMQPVVKALASEPSADMARKLNPLRLSYTMFADANPWMKLVQKLAGDVVASRKPVAPDNSFLAMQTLMSRQIMVALDGYRMTRDAMNEHAFFSIFGSHFLQTWLGVRDADAVREVARISPARRADYAVKAAALGEKLDKGGDNEALVRAMLYVIGGGGVVDQRCALALNVMRQEQMHLSLAAAKEMARDQFTLLQLDEAGALSALATIVPAVEARRRLLAQVRDVVRAGDAPDAAARARLDRVSQILSTPEARGRGRADGVAAQ